MKKGIFIVLDGGDGAGKSSVAKKLKEIYGDNLLITREPGGSAYAEKIREIILSDDGKDADPETQFLLFWAARRDILTKVIKPALDEGKIVVCDRFDSSTYAYQIYAPKRFELEPLFWYLREAMLLKDKLEPDLYILLDVDPETGIERAKGRGALNHFDKKSLDFRSRVSEGLKEFILNKVPNGISIDANQDFKKVLLDLNKELSERFSKIKRLSDFEVL